MFKAHTTKKIIIRLIFYQRDLKKKSKYFRTVFNNNNSQYLN